MAGVCEKKCGECSDFFAENKSCGNPMVYLNHSDNKHKTTSETTACGWFSAKTQGAMA